MEALQQALSSRGLAVVHVPGKGRGLVTTKDFSAGDVIFYQEPYASTPSKLLGGSVCDGCFASSNLRKCSGCRIAWYCGNVCQRSEWKVHQLECQALAGLSEDRRKLLTPSIRLMVKLLLRRKLQDEQVIPTTPTDNYDSVNALVSHISDIDEKQFVLYAQMANLVKLVVPYVEINLKEVAENFSKIACNAHTICDSRVAVVRAMEPITEGTEVLISYIETAATTSARQKDLKQYFFNCRCPRCTKSLDEDLQENATMEGYRCMDKKCYGFLLRDTVKQTFICQQCGLARDQEETKKTANEIEKSLSKASTCLSSGNYSEASALYKNIEQIQSKLCHPFSINLMRTRETLMKIFMELKDWRSALTICQLTITVYQRVYPENHPMVGLQYYTCGKLEWLLELTDDALKSFTKATNILRITHGTNTPFMRELLNKLDEARAEAAYKHSAGRSSPDELL